MGFKEDERFLRYLTMGAAGSAATAHYLTKVHGHRMVELERYTMANKLWSTKVKRLRLPDLICIDCGQAVEAKAKSTLEIKMSESVSGDEDRVWDAGNSDDDLIAFVYWDEQNQEAAERPAFFTVGAMREAIAWSRTGGRKSASEGSEVDRTWPARCPKHDGEVLVAEERKGKTLLATGRRQTYYLPDDCPSFVYVEAGDAFVGNQEFLLGVVRPPESLDCLGRTWDFASALEAGDPTRRYAAVKVAGIWRDDSAIEALETIADEGGDWRLPLEAVTSLARIRPAEYTSRLVELAGAESDDRAMAMEATFALSELGTPEAADGLLSLAEDTSRDSEVRAAAVWGLGVAGAQRPELVLPFIADDDDAVALHALSGIGPLPAALIPEAQALLHEKGRGGAAAAALLSRQGAAGAEALLQATANVETLIWALVGLDQMPESVVRGVGELPAEIERALEPTWAAREESWLGLAEGGQELVFMERQTVRHKPPDVGESPD